ASFAVDHGNVSGFGESPQTTAEAPRHPHEVGVVEMLIRAIQLLPPSAEATARVAHAKVGVQDKAIHTIVRAFEKVSVVLAQCVWHPVTLPHPQRSRKSNGNGRRVSTSCVRCPARGPFSERSLGKSVVRYRGEIVNFVRIFVCPLSHEHQAAFKPTASVSSFKA